MTDTFVLVYGNHSGALALLDDYFEYFQQMIEGSDQRLILSEKIVPGAVNFIIDQFNSAFVSDAKIIRKETGTYYVLIGTEFITGKTFNNFGFNLALRRQIKKDAQRAFFRTLKHIVRTVLTTVPLPVRDLSLKLFPRTYMALKSKFLSPSPQSSVIQFAELRRYWKERFLAFTDMAQLSDQIWCVSPHQLPAYREEFGSKVKLLPIVSWTQALAKNVTPDPDIDFLFTGTLTPHRKAVLDTLSDAGYRVVVGPAEWTNCIRSHFMSRAKICLHLKQSHDWQYPSIMRLHHLVSHGHVVMAEMASSSCDQETFATRCDSSNILSEAARQIALGDFGVRGHEGALNYYSYGKKGRAEIKAMLQALLKRPSPKSSEYRADPSLGFPS